MKDVENISQIGRAPEPENAQGNLGHANFGDILRQFREEAGLLKMH